MTCWAIVCSESSGLFVRHAEIVFTEVHALHVIFDEKPPPSPAFEAHALLRSVFFTKQLVVLLLKAVPWLEDQPADEFQHSTPCKLVISRISYQSLKALFAVQNVRHKDHRARTHRK
jgi:hypothetical protein